MTLGRHCEKHPLPIGGGLALVTVPLHAFIPFWWSHQLAALVLALIAGIYVGFAVLDGRTRIILVELMVAFAFIAFACAAMIYDPIWLPLGYVAHGLWDALHHSPLFDTKMPRWYIPLCAVYDIIAGAGIWLIWVLR